MVPSFGGDGKECAVVEWSTDEGAERRRFALLGAHLWGGNAKDERWGFEHGKRTRQVKQALQFCRGKTLQPLVFMGDFNAQRPEDIVIQERRDAFLRYAREKE